MNVLVTGGGGFVGSALAAYMRVRGLTVTIAVRDARAWSMSNGAALGVGNIGPQTDWRAALRTQECVVHTAAHVHSFRRDSAAELAEYQSVNVGGTMKLAHQAAEMGIRRFVFVSSIKVNGETSPFGRPMKADDTPAPADMYAMSKLQAEYGLFQIAATTNMEVVVVRPPLVYGPGVKANFLRMLQWLYRRVPLPLGAIRNRRSMIGLDNLVDLMSVCTVHPAAANRVFLACDGEDLSTTELLQRLGSALNREAILFPVPERLLVACASVSGLGPLARRLCESLRIDATETKKILGWSPAMTVDEGLGRVAADFLRSQGN